MTSALDEYMRPLQRAHVCRTEASELKWTVGRRHRHRPPDAELGLEAREAAEGPSCSAGGNELCSDEVEHYERSHEMLQGSILEIGGAAAGLMPLGDQEPDSRRRARRGCCGPLDPRRGV